MKGCDDFWRVSVLLRPLSVLLLLLSCSGIAAAASDQQIELSFREFAGEYMRNLRQENCRSDKDSQLQAYDQGVFIRTVAYEGQWAIQLKKTDSRLTPYIGLLNYLETHLVKYGPEAETLALNPEIVVTEIPVTEIFRFSEGSWQY